DRIRFAGLPGKRDPEIAGSGGLRHGSGHGGGLPVRGNYTDLFLASMRPRLAFRVEIDKIEFPIQAEGRKAIACNRYSK
ncbi:MAG TPA: hypothetical protein VKB27_12175, partial [Gammaproteobacteria bacterium]|nr:hypothetical protein [Gammaproteobacteria bacterium]